MVYSWYREIFLFHNANLKLLNLNNFFPKSVSVLKQKCSILKTSRLFNYRNLLFRNKNLILVSPLHKLIHQNRLSVIFLTQSTFTLNIYPDIIIMCTKQQVQNEKKQSIAIIQQIDGHVDLFNTQCVKWTIFRCYLAHFDFHFNNYYFHNNKEAIYILFMCSVFVWTGIWISIENNCGELI